MPKCNLNHLQSSALASSDHTQGIIVHTCDTEEDSRHYPSSYIICCHLSVTVIAAWLPIIYKHLYKHWLSNERLKKLLGCYPLDHITGLGWILHCPAIYSQDYWLHISRLFGFFVYRDTSKKCNNISRVGMQRGWYVVARLLAFSLQLRMCEVYIGNNILYLGVLFSPR